MAVQRKLRRVIQKRLKADNIEKNEKIGELLGMDPVPVHHLAYKEQRLDRSDGDCYPLVDVFLRIAELVGKPKLNVVDEVFSCGCGFEAKTKAGLSAHQRKCEKVG